jgi:site-specific DNA recombinase
MVERFARIMQERIRSGEIPFRKAYLRAVIDRVDVDDHAIRIIGDKATLEQAVFRSSEDPAKAVRSSVRNWRALRDSNPCFRRERATS